MYLEFIKNLYNSIINRQNYPIKKMSKGSE